MSQNLHKFYYKDYFLNNGISVNFSYLLEDNKKAPNDVVQAIKRNNEKLCKPSMLKVIPRLSEVNRVLQLKVLYPGLVTGVGIDHETKIESEFKLGVHFDWTYGMPIVYGSSVKGVLKTYFEEFCDLKNKRELKKDIFEGEGKSIYDRDIFFDAVIVKPDYKGRILCSDSITPHIQGPLKNPIPITFMKIAPGCELEFRFKLVDTIIGDFKYKAEEKLIVFKEILTTVGIGAKTNVGYGQLK